MVSETAVLLLLILRRVEQLGRESCAGMCVLTFARERQRINNRRSGE